MKDKIIFLRDFETVVDKHPESWNKPCVLPRDLDCGRFLTDVVFTRVDTGLNVLEWIENGKECWAHFNEIYIQEPTEILGKIYVNNVERVE